MKAKLSLTIDEHLIRRSKQMARDNGLSVSELVEQLLRAATSKPSPSFPAR
jgi:hypothetical protein